MSLLAGSRLGRYKIIGPLGKGGMGEVYRARDTQLDREVAIKVLPEHLAQDPDALKRFEREAKAVAALSHLNILTIYDVGSQQAVSFAVMELLEGETLRTAIAQGALPWRNAVEVAGAVAEGLAAAHSKGVIHRDLKPENIFLTSEGVVKILDFGLARYKPQVTQQELTSAPTESRVTEEGTVMGTVPYMSPEQVRGETVDSRSDIFSFGCVLYEMVSGKGPFLRGSSVDTISAILRDDPPELPENMPPDVAHVINHCLEKNPQKRFQTASDLVFALRQVGSQIVRPTARSKWTRHIATLSSIVIVLAAIIALITGFRKQSPQIAPQQKIQSLAVLPLKNLSGDPQREYFADGMTEELITELAKISSLKVISRTSSLQYKGVKKSLPTVAKELDVDALIEGSVLAEGDQVRITIQLIDGATDRHLWAQSYRRPMRGVLDLQSEMARAIASEIRVKLSPEEEQRLARTRQVNPAAHEAYLKGRYYLQNPTDQAIHQALGLFQQAVSLDPNDPLAHAGLADAYFWMGNYSLLRTNEAYAKAKVAAERAIELDENLAEAHAALANVLHQYDWDQVAAEREYRRALELAASTGTMRADFGFFLCQLGRYEEALTEGKRAHQLDPLNLYTMTIFGHVLHFSRRYDEGIAQYKQVLELDAFRYETRWYLALAYGHKGAFDQAISELRTLDPTLLSTIAMMEGFSGNKGRAMKVLNTLKQKRENEYVRPYQLAWLSLAGGDKDQALDWLEKGCDERDDWMTYLYVDAFMDPLRSEPRFQIILKRVGLPVAEKS